jgi:hypothetical protein
MTAVSRRAPPALAGGALCFFLRKVKEHGPRLRAGTGLCDHAGAERPSRLSIRTGCFDCACVRTRLLEWGLRQRIGDVRQPKRDKGKEKQLHDLVPVHALRLLRGRLRRLTLHSSGSRCGRGSPRTSCPGKGPIYLLPQHAGRLRAVAGTRAVVSPVSSPRTRSAVSHRPSNAGLTYGPRRERPGDDHGISSTSRTGKRSVGPGSQPGMPEWRCRGGIRLPKTRRSTSSSALRTVLAWTREFIGPKAPSPRVSRAERLATGTSDRRFRG